MQQITQNNVSTAFNDQLIPQEPILTSRVFTSRSPTKLTIRNY